jgi:hypothetical protein
VAEQRSHYRANWMVLSTKTGRNFSEWLFRTTLPVGIYKSTPSYRRLIAVCTLLERGLRPSYALKSPNKQLMHTFLHFVVRLQSRFYTLALIFVFDLNIYSSSLRLFKIDPVISLLAATNRQYFILVLSLPLRWLRITFVLNTLIALKIVIFQASDIAKRLSINFLVILQRYRYN